MAGHTDSVNGVLYLPDGSFLSWSDDKTIQIWTRNGESIKVMAGHKAAVWDVIRIHNGCFLSRSADNTLRIWDSVGECLNILEGHSEAIDGAINLTDDSILSSSRDGTLILWDSDGKAINSYHEDFIFKYTPFIWQSFLPSTQRMDMAGLHCFKKQAVLGTAKGLELIWQSASEVEPGQIFADGRALVFQAIGQVCLLRPWLGNRRATLEDLSTA